jgi:hypothetical protein
MITLGAQTLNHSPYEIDPTRHINVIGGSGVGKSSLLEHVFLEFVKHQGHGGLFIDPHGDTADRLPLLIPKSRRRDIIWFDPDAPAVPALNPLYFTDPEQLELAKETCLTILKALSGSDSAWGNATPYNIRNDLDAVTENTSNISTPTLVHVFRFLVDEPYRKLLMDASENPFVKLFQAQLESIRDVNSLLAPGVNKLAKLMRPNIISAVGQPECLDLLKVMNEGKIIICRFSKGRLGEETAQILYSLIVSMVSIAALKREQQSERPPFMIVADEAQNAIHGGRFGTLLAEARKYGISLVTAFQGFYQVPFADDILTNAATQIVFNASGDDAITMSKNWNQPEVEPQNISELSRYEFYCRTFEGNQPVVRKILAPPHLKLHYKAENAKAAALQKTIDRSLREWATDRKATQKKINKFLAV